MQLHLFVCLSLCVSVLNKLKEEEEKLSDINAPTCLSICLSIYLFECIKLFKQYAIHLVALHIIDIGATWHVSFQLITLRGFHSISCLIINRRLEFNEKKKLNRVVAPCHNLEVLQLVYNRNTNFIFLFE